MSINGQMREHRTERRGDWGPRTIPASVGGLRQGSRGHLQPQVRGREGGWCAASQNRSLSLENTETPPHPHSHPSLRPSEASGRRDSRLASEAAGEGGGQCHGFCWISKFGGRGATQSVLKTDIHPRGAVRGVLLYLRSASSALAARPRPRAVPDRTPAGPWREPSTELRPRPASATAPACLLGCRPLDLPGLLGSCQERLSERDPDPQAWRCCSGSGPLRA